MTKKDYTIIAQSIADVWKAYYENENQMSEECVLDLIELNLSENLKAQNDRFDAVKFSKAIRTLKRQ